MPGHRATHPTGRALFLMVGVVVAVVILAAMSTFAGR